MPKDSDLPKQTAPFTRDYPSRAGGEDASILPGGETGGETFVEDFTGETGSKFETLQPGFYAAICIDLDKGLSEAGNPQYIWDFEVLDPQYKGQKIRFWTSLVAQARWKVVSTLEALGIPAEGSIARFKRSDVIGKAVLLEVSNSEYKGQNRHHVQSVLEPDDRAKGLAKVNEDSIPV